MARHPATDDRVREEAALLLAEIEAHLPSPDFEAAQASSHQFDFDAMVAQVLQ